MDLAPNQLPAEANTDRPGAHGDADKGRVAIFNCAQQVLAPEIHGDYPFVDPTWLSSEVLSADCCGAITHHMGKQDSSHSLAQNLIQALQNAEQVNGEFDARHYGKQLRDHRQNHGHMFQDDKIWAQGAARVSALAKDVTEFLSVDDVAGKASRLG